MFSALPIIVTTEVADGLADALSLAYGLCDQTTQAGTVEGDVYPAILGSGPNVAASMLWTLKV